MRVLRQTAWFVVVGTAGTVAYVLLHLLLRTWLPDVPSLATAWLVSTVATNLVHRRLTFGVKERRGRVEDNVAFLLTSLLGLGLTTWWVSRWAGEGALEQTVVIVAATGLAGILRFALMHVWVRLVRRPGPPATGDPTDAAAAAETSSTAAGGREAPRD